MWYFITKVAVSATLIVAISELAKRNSMMGALLASLPVISILAMVWLYHESGDTSKIIALSSDIFWLALPSLTLFIALPMLLKSELSFYSSLCLSIFITIIAYGILIAVLSHFR